MFWCPVFLFSGTCPISSGMKYIADKKTKKYELNKNVARAVLKVKQPVVALPAEMPANIVAFNKNVDKVYAKYAKQVRKAMKKF